MLFSGTLSIYFRKYLHAHEFICETVLWAWCWLSRERISHEYVFKQTNTGEKVNNAWPGYFQDCHHESCWMWTCPSLFRRKPNKDLAGSRWRARIFRNKCFAPRTVKQAVDNHKMELLPWFSWLLLLSPELSIWKYFAEDDDDGIGWSCISIGLLLEELLLQIPLPMLLLLPWTKLLPRLLKK